MDNLVVMDTIVVMDNIVGMDSGDVRGGGDRKKLTSCFTGGPRVQVAFETLCTLIDLHVAFRLARGAIELGRRYVVNSNIRRDPTPAGRRRRGFICWR